MESVDDVCRILVTDLVVATERYRPICRRQGVQSVIGELKVLGSVRLFSPMGDWDHRHLWWVNSEIRCSPQICISSVADHYTVFSSLQSV